MSVQSAFSQNFPMPIGCVVTYLGADTPPSFLLCDGTTHSISEYPYLYNTLKDAYGGDGITTFSVPNLVGEFISGIEQNTNPPTYTIGGGSFTGNWSRGDDCHTKAFARYSQVHDHRGACWIAFCTDFKQSRPVDAERDACHTLKRDCIDLLDNSSLSAQ